MRKYLFKIVVLLFLLVIVSLLFDNSFAWITKSNVASVNDNEYPVTEAEEMGISSNSISFGNLLTFSTEGKMITPLAYNKNNDSIIKPIFNKVLNKNTNLYENNLMSVTNANQNEYIEEEFYLKVTDNTRIGINLDNTNIQGIELINAYGLDVTNIKCAFKVLLYQYANGEYDLKLVYSPYAKYELNKTNNQISLSQNGNLDDKYYFLFNGISNINFTNSEYQLNNGVYYLYKDTGKFYFTSSTNDIEKFKIIIYLDGFDRECVNYLNYNDEYNDIYCNLRFTFDFCME